MGSLRNGQGEGTRKGPFTETKNVGSGGSIFGGQKESTSKAGTWDDANVRQPDMGRPQKGEVDV